MRPLRIAGVASESIVDGPGLRYVVFVQGCPLQCKGCHNPQTHDPEGGAVADIAQILAEIDANPLLSGVTFSGGEPFDQAEQLWELAEQVKARGLHLLIYSGYTFERLRDMARRDAAVLHLLTVADVLIDGPYMEDQRDLTLQFRGSRNQRIIDMSVARDIIYV